MNSVSHLSDDELLKMADDVFNDQISEPLVTWSDIRMELEDRLENRSRR